VEHASPHLARLAREPRPAGSAAAAGARAYCANVLRAAGFDISEQEFEYSRFPGAWSMPIAGVGASLGAILLYLGRQVPWLAVAGGLLVVLVVAGVAWLGGRGVLGFPVARRRGVNLQAVRGGGDPPVWLVAHIDSKWQPVSMVARVAGVIGTAAGLIVLAALALARSSAADTVAAATLMLTWVFAAPLVLSIAEARNTGALDNASGVCAVLEAVESLPATARVGVLITDAEEMALAGALAWARGRAPSVALNCDSVDDHGTLTVMYSRSRPAALVSQLEGAARIHGERLRVLRLIPGVLTDSVALANAGWKAVTLSHGDLRTLQRIHTAGDTLATLRGTGIASAARILAHTAMELGG